MTISQMFKVLEQKGYIYRQCHSSDVRAKSVSLTEEGKHLMSKAVTTIITLDNKFFGALGKKQKQFNQSMVELLKAND